MKKDKKTAFWKTIWDFAKNYKKNLIAGMIFSFLTGIAVAFQPIIIKHIIDDGITNATLSNIDRVTTAALFCGVYIVVHVIRMITWSVGYKNCLEGLEGFLFEVRSKFFEHIQTLCMRFYDKMSSGELFNYIMGSPVSNLKNFLQQFALNIPYQSIALIISVCAMVSYDWLLTIVMVAALLVCLAFNIHSRKKIRRISGELLKTESEASKYINDMIHGNNAIKMYAIEDEIHYNFDSYVTALKNNGVKLSFTQWIEQSKPELTQQVGIALVYLVGAISCVYRGLSIGELTAFISSMNIIMTTLTSWFNINLLRSNAEASLDRITSIMQTETSTPETKLYHSLEVEERSARKKGLPCIEFKDVMFGYDNRKIFNHFNCKMEYNKSFGLVGSSGSGKSTITKLIMRLYEVEDGEILMHGYNIKKYSLHDLRRSIGIVPQEPFIFQMSIIDNIRIACPDAPMNEIMEAMTTARVHEFVNDLPNGWNTIVGDGGFGLSGGQKQRIAIARAVLGNPDILIFDEATSALDNVSEKHIQNAVDELMRSHTVIIVAHRLTTIKNVDKIFVFDKGEIVQSGSFDELSSQDGMFKEMLEVSKKEN
jgi:ABC-type multidrug transport system fused ATPase/permease subunit